MPMVSKELLRKVAQTIKVGLETDPNEIFTI